MQKYILLNIVKINDNCTCSFFGKHGSASVYYPFEKFNVSLTNDVVSFEQLSPDV